MKKLVTCLLMSLVLFSFAYSQGKGETEKLAEKDLIEARKNMADADKRQDVKLMDSLLSDDYVWISFSGHTGGKDATLAGLKEERPKDSSSGMKEENVKIRIYNDAAVVTGTLTVTFSEGGKPGSVTGRFTQVWIKRQGHWQIVSIQATPSKTT